MSDNGTQGEGALKKGALVLSIDTELAWGAVHHGSAPEAYPHWRDYDRVRPAVDRLLAAMDRYDISCTWAVVGHLMLDRCEPVGGVKHPELKRPAYSWFKQDDWFYADPASSASEAPKWYGPDVISKIRGAKTKHEIGSHTFSHMIIGDPGCSAEVFSSDLDAHISLANKAGIKLESFVYPKNRVGHAGELAARGFTCYRTSERPWYSRFSGRMYGLAYKADIFTPVPPPVTFPRSRGGVWELPASYYYRIGGGWASRQPMAVRRWKLRLGLRRAAARKGMLHIWFHPYDIAGDIERLMPPLEATFKEAAKLRDAGKLDVLTMGEVARRMSSPATAGAAAVNGKTAVAAAGQAATPR